jgi:hypothetical protein
MGDARCNGSAAANYSAVMSDTVRGDVHELTLRLSPGSPAGSRHHPCDCTTVVRPFGRREGAPATAGKVTNRQHRGSSSPWCGRQRSPRARRAPGPYQRSPRSRLPEKSDAHDQKNRPGVDAGLRQRPSRSGRRHSVRHRLPAPPSRHLPPAVYRDRPRSSLQRVHRYRRRQPCSCLDTGRCARSASWPSAGRRSRPSLVAEPAVVHLERQPTLIRGAGVTRVAVKPATEKAASECDGEGFVEKYFTPELLSPGP